MMKKTLSIIGLLAFAGAASAQTGSANDMYVFGDGSSQVYQVTLAGAEVTNARTGSHFALSADTRGISPYRATWGGVNNNFFIGGFGGLTEIDGNTGAFVKQIGSGGALDVQISQTGTTLYRGDGLGVGEYDINTGARIRTLTTGVGAQGNTLMKARGNSLYVSGWNSNVVIKVDQTTGAQDMSFGTVTMPFMCQALETDSFGNLYASALYEGGAVSGVWKYDPASGTWSMFARASDAPNGTGNYPYGPHGFTFGPDGNLYVAHASGGVEKYNGITGAYVGQVWFVNDKLTDVQFKPVPAPGAFALLGLAGVAGLRRRR